MLQVRTMSEGPSKLTRIDPENDHTKQDYYISDSELLKIASFSSLKNALFFISAFILDISAVFLLINGGWVKISVGLVFIVVSGYCLISRRELYITKEFARRTYTISCFGHSSRVWQTKHKFDGFSRFDINWPETKHIGSSKQKVQLSIYNYELGKSINIMDFFFMSADQELLTDIIQRIEQVLGLPANVSRG